MTTTDKYSDRDLFKEQVEKVVQELELHGMTLYHDERTDRWLVELHRDTFLLFDIFTGDDSKKQIFMVTHYASINRLNAGVEYSDITMSYWDMFDENKVKALIRRTNTTLRILSHEAELNAVSKLREAMIG